jgi:uncharacterized protein (TIGR00730 family)
MPFSNIFKHLTEFFSASKFSFVAGLELIVGMIFLRGINPCVTIFGSARFHQDHQDYKNVRLLASELAKLGYPIITGGGPGLMEAANRGAKDAGGISIGCSIDLLKHEPTNIYLDRNFSFKHFFTRKIMLSRNSVAFVAAPGGFGTLDELFEIITLAQTSKLRGVTIYLLNTEYWKPIIEFASKQMLQYGTIGQADLGLIKYSNNPVEIAAAISKNHNIKKIRISTDLQKKDNESRPITKVS